MKRICKPLHALTATDVMTHVPVTVHHRMTLRAAARVFARWKVHELLVTDDQERLVGVLTPADLLRWALDDGPGNGRGYDTSAWMDWQLMAPGAGRTDEVRWHLTADYVAVAPDTPLADLAQRMRDRCACCAIVIDRRGCPIGVVSGVDLLAVALAPATTETSPPATRRAARRSLIRRS